MTPKESRERRITITLSKKQKAYLLDFAARRKLTPSKLVAYLLYVKTKDLQQTEALIEKPKEEIQRAKDEEISDEEMKELYKELENVKRG